MYDEEFIAIPHFINPQLFWYHKVDGQNPSSIELQRIEESLEALYTEQRYVSQRPYRARVGDIVAVAFVSWNKYIRARVENIATYTSTEDEYVVWALDYGFPFETKLIHIRKLTEPYTGLTDHIRLGAIANVIPAEEEFDLVTITSRMVPKQSWSRRAVEWLEKLISDAASISFIEFFSEDGGSQKQHYGDLKIISHSGKEFIVSENLVKLNYAMKCVNDFRVKLATLKTTKIPCWQTNNGYVKLIENNLNTMNVYYRHQQNLDLSGSMSVSPCDTFSKQKVMDWCERNLNCPDRNYSNPDGFCQASALDASDFSFDDSVSVKNLKAINSRAPHDETVMGYAGALHETRRKLYEGKKLPPKPNMEVFELFESKQDDLDKSTGSGSSGRPLRAKALMELRKKYKKTAKVGEETILQKEMNKLSISSPSESGTEEFLESCKKKNARQSHLENLREMRKSTEDVDANNVKQPVDVDYNNASSSVNELGNACSSVSTSSRYLLLKKIKEKHSKQNAKAQKGTDSSDHIPIFGRSTDAQSQTESKISVHAAKLISMRKKIKEKYSQQSQSENCFIDTANYEESAPNVRCHNNSYKMPQENTNFSKLDSSIISSFKKEETPSLKLDEMIPPTVPDLGSQCSFGSSQTTSSREIELRNLRKMINENPFQNMTMVPAGYNLDKLVQRKDEQNHWHTKKTTLNDSLHSNYSCEESNSNYNSPKQSITRRTEEVDQQNFRLTRCRKERKKENSNKSDEKHLLDMSLQDDCCAQAIKPVNVADKSVFKSHDLICTVKEDKFSGENNVTNDPSDTLNKSDKLIDFSATSDDLDVSTSSDSFLKFVTEKNSVCGTSREKLLETSNVTSDSSLNLLSVVATEKPLDTNQIDSVKVNGIDSSSSISSSSFSKPESSRTPICWNEGLKRATKDPHPTYEASSSSACSSLIKIAGKPEPMVAPSSQLNKLPNICKKSSQLSKSLVESASAAEKSVLDKLQQSSSSSSLKSTSDSSTRNQHTAEDIKVLPNNPATTSTSSLEMNTCPNLLVKPLSLSLSSLEKSNASRKQSTPFSERTDGNVTSSLNSLKLNESPLHLPEVAGEAPLKTNLIQHLVLTHGEVTVTPIERMNNALFPPEVHQEMENMRLTKMYRIQSYAWSHLVRGNSFFVINASRTGKTWCYMPPVCSMVSFRLETKSVPQTYGPVAVIIAPSSAQVESIARNCRRLLASTKTRVTIVPTYAFRNAEEVKIELHNGCGILVVTPPSLRRLLVTNEREALLNMERIQCVVVDDLDTLISQNDEFDETLHKLIGPAIQHRGNGKVPFQMIVTTKRWSRRMINLLRISNQPLLCIADYLEAAVYAKAKIAIKLQSSAEKMSVMLKCLEKCPYTLERVVIICNSEYEVDKVNKCLVEAGLVCFAYTENMSVEIFNLISEWKEKTICHQILVTTDCVLPELMIQNVWTVIHYSLPTSWTKFNFRFSLFLKNYANLLKTDFEKPTKVPKSVILLDEENNLQLPRLIEFMKLHNQLKHIQPDILHVAETIAAEREESRVAEGVLMCPNILEFGSCDEHNRCSHRHQLTKYDTPMEGIPTQGEIRIKILDVLSPTHYTARLLTHKQGDTWEIVQRSNEVTHFFMQLTLHFMNDNAQIVHWPLRANDLCVYKGDGIFHRCRLLKVPTIVDENIVKLVNVKVKLIDSGSSLMCKSHDLFVIPENFKDFPAQAVDIRLSGVVPYDNERAWGSRSTRTVKNWIMTDVTDKDFLQASINFALIDTIWVNNVFLLERLAAIRGYSVKINVRRSLLGKEFALADDRMNSLKQTAMENGLLELTPEVSKQEECNDNVEESQNLLEFSTSISSGNNETAQQAISKSVEVSIPKSTKMVSVRVVSDEASEEWMQLELDELFQVKITQLHDPGKFYLRLMNKEDELNELDDMIRIQKKIPLEDPHPMQNCLALYGGQYYRAKIQRVIVDSTDGCVEVRLFFCDLGIFWNCPLKQLRSSSKSLIEYIPFQAICCKLTGLNVEYVGEKIENLIQLKDSVHLAYGVKEISGGDECDEVLSIRNYEIILYECFTDKNDIQINKLLVERGLASYDNRTKHFLELETKVDFADYDYEQGEAEESYDFQEFLNRIKQQMDEDDAEEEKMLNASYKAIEEIKDEEPKIVEITTAEPSSEEVTQHPKKDLTPPTLKTLHKRPLTTWYETMCMIYLVIHAPDISDYHLEVTPKQLIFVAFINGQHQLLILNLLGYVEPDQVTHEIRGLNVIVRLVKSVYMEWPRLLEDSTKFSWLTYNYNAIDAMEAEQLIDGDKRLHKRTRNNSYIEDDDSETSDFNPCETFTPIVNLDDVHDPTQELY